MSIEQILKIVWENNKRKEKSKLVLRRRRGTQRGAWQGGVTTMRWCRWWWHRSLRRWVSWWEAVATTWTSQQWGGGNTVIGVRDVARHDKSEEAKEGGWWGSWKVFGKEYRVCGGIFIVIETMNNNFNLEPLLILLAFISSGSSYESLLILLVFINNGSSYEPLLMMILSAEVLVMNYCW
jgi:hypothetical protein